MKHRITTFVVLTLLAVTPMVLAASGESTSVDRPVAEAADQLPALDTGDGACEPVETLPVLDPLAGALPQLPSCAPGIPSCYRDSQCDLYCLKQDPYATGWCHDYCCGCSTQ
jgi:hypothetical protein